MWCRSRTGRMKPPWRCARSQISPAMVPSSHLTARRSPISKLHRRRSSTPRPPLSIAHQLRSVRCASRAQQSARGHVDDRAARSGERTRDGDRRREPGESVAGDGAWRSRVLLGSRGCRRRAAADLSRQRCACRERDHVRRGRQDTGPGERQLAAAASTPSHASSGAARASTTYNHPCREKQRVTANVVATLKGTVN